MEVGEQPHGSSSSEQTFMRRGRPKVLHRCAISLFLIVSKVYRRIEDLDSFIGILARLVAFLAGPFIGWMVQYWLFWFSFTDSIILTVEKILIYFVPNLRPIFEKIYGLVSLMDSLPEKLDQSIDEPPSLVEKTPDLPQCASVFNNFPNINIELTTSSIQRKEEQQLERKEEGELEFKRKEEGRQHKDEQKTVMDEDGEKQSGASEKPQKESTDNPARLSILDLFEEGWHMEPLAGSRRYQ